MRVCALSGLDTTIGANYDATHTRWKSIDSANAFTMEGTFGTENSSDLNNGEWAVTFSYGTVKGMAKCSETNGDYATVGNPSNTTGQYCWCGATIYTQNGGNACNVAPSLWVFNSDVQYVSNCELYCANSCAYGVGTYADFRRAMFGVAQ